jgi:prepilin-type N-terminal cleavage/methylation domain-containing protein
MYKFLKKNGAKGFTLAELLIVIAIIGVLGAIALPAVINQRTQAVEAGMQADLLGASSSIDLLITTWRGVPPSEITIATTDDTWAATALGVAEPYSDGGVSEGTSLEGKIWVDGSYCLAVTNPVTSTSLIYRSDERNVVPGTCPTAALGGVGTLPGTIALDLPDMPGSLVATSPSDNTVTVSWSAVLDATSYTVSIAGISSQEVLSPTTNATFTEVPPGTLTVVVYAQNGNGAGPGAYASVAVAGSIEYALSSRLASYTYSVANQAQKATIAGQPAGSTVWVADTAWSETWNGAEWVITGGQTPHASLSRGTNLNINNELDAIFTGNLSNGSSGIEQSAGVFTIPRDGKYNITFALVLDNVNNTGLRSAYVQLNGTESILFASSPATTNFDSYLSGSRTVTLSQGDTLSLRIYQSSGETVVLLAGSSTPAYFDITYVGP